MISPITTTVQPQPVVLPEPVAQPTTPSHPSSITKVGPVPSDTVSISSVAAAMLKEAVETSVQTAKEAAGGDLQAQRLLAKEAQKLS